jgi:integrase
MGRPRTPLSAYGTIAAVEVAPGKWRARTRYRFDDGKLRQVERFSTTRAKAETALRKALTTIQVSTAVDVKRETRLRDLGARFLTAKAGRAPRTIEAYKHSVEKVIVPRIGDLAVSEATTERLQRFIDLVTRENGPGAAKTARAVLSGMMGLAARSDAVRTNPVRELAPIEGKPQGAQAVPLAELPNLLQKVRADERLQEVDLVEVVEFVAGTGSRISEALEMTWDDVDLEKRTVTIGSKTEASRRTIRVPASVHELLSSRAARREPKSYATVVFPTVLLKPWDPRRAAGEWKDARERLELPDRWTFHAFRKTVATALDQAGLSARDIAEYLGHKDPSLTQSVYMSKTVGGSRAADALESFMSPKATKGKKSVARSSSTSVLEGRN